MGSSDSPVPTEFGAGGPSAPALAEGKQTDASSSPCSDRGGCRMLAGARRPGRRRGHDGPGDGPDRAGQPSGPADRGDRAGSGPRGGRPAGAAQHGLLREALQDRVLRAGPDRAGLQPPGAVPAGHHGPGPDDRHRGFLRIADGRSRPGGIRQGGAPAGAAVAAGHPARWPGGAVQAERQPRGLGRRDRAGRGVRPHHRAGREHPAGRDADLGERGDDGLPPDREGGEVRGQPPPGRRDQPELLGHGAELQDPVAAAEPARRLHRGVPLGRHGAGRLG